MKSPDGATKSSWYSGVTIPQFDPPPGPAQADVCVVGAGIAGLTTAYLLAAEGKSVIVLDEGPIGSGQTGRTSAHLSSIIDDRFVEMERLHGEENTRLTYQSHVRAIDTIERISHQENIDCEFARLNAFLTLSPASPPDFLDREYAAARRAGVADIEKCPHGGMSGGPALQFGRQARFHPLKYLIGLANALVKHDGKIYTGQRVVDVQGADSSSSEPAHAELADGNQITADHIVVATNTPAPINDWMGIYTKQAAYRTYVIAGVVPRGSIADALYWDTANPYHYVRLESGDDAKSDLLLVGGEDHKTGQFREGAAPFIRLESWARERFPMLERIAYRWSGQVQEPADGIAFIGRAPTARENVYVITGDSGMGLTHGTIGGLLITDLIMGRSNPWEGIYDPSRKTMNKDFLLENANTVAQYKDFLTPGEIKSADALRPGQGAIMRDGITKLAVYRDPAGVVHRHSAICTHLQCVVQWNPVEKTWDCPCHGSRFDAVGKVLMGPAIEDLPQAE